MGSTYGSVEAGSPPAGQSPVVSIGGARGGVGPAVVMAAGLGWIGGTFHWPGPQWWDQVLITVAHLVPVGVVAVAVSLIVTGRRPRAGRVTLTVSAALIKTVTVAAIVMVVTHPHGAGPHGFLDWVPIGMANAGGGLWLKTMLFRRRSAGSGGGEPAAMVVR